MNADFAKRFFDRLRLKGRAAIVTGASRGIGKATALTFAREGANVMVNFQRNSEKAEEVAEYIREIGREALPFRADVSRINEVEGMIQAALGRFGRIDISLTMLTSLGAKAFKTQVRRNGTE